MSSIASRRLARRNGTGAQPEPLNAAKLRHRNVARARNTDRGRRQSDNVDSDTEEEVEELDTPSPKTPETPDTPKSPDSPQSATTTTRPQVTIPITALPPANTPPTITTNTAATSTTAVAPPPPPPPTRETERLVTTTTAVPSTTTITTPSPPPPPPPPPPPVTATATTTAVLAPTTTLQLTPVPPTTVVKNPARESDVDTSETETTSAETASPPPPSDATTTTSPSTTIRTPDATSSPASTSTTQVTTKFVLSSTGFTNGVPTTLLITLPNSNLSPPTTLLTRTSTNTKTSTSTTANVPSTSSPSSTSSSAVGSKTSMTTGLGFMPIESAAPVLQPSSTASIGPEADHDPKAFNQAPTLTTGGVAALSIVIALASIASIAFLVWKCCWPRRNRNLPPPPGSAPFQHLKFWERPSGASSRSMGIGSESGTLPPPGAPQMAHIRPEDMDQVMAAAYEAEQGNSGVYGRYADQRQRGSWHTDDSSILEEKQRQYEAAVAASAINGTAPPDPRRSRAMQLGQMMNSFLHKRHDNPGYAGSGGSSVGAPGGLTVPERGLAPGVRPPDTPTGTTSGPTAFMPKNNRVEWSWRISVGRRASRENAGEGWMSKASRFAGLKA